MLEHTHHFNAVRIAKLITQCDNLGEAITLAERIAEAWYAFADATDDLTLTIRRNGGALWWHGRLNSTEANGIEEYMRDVIDNYFNWDAWLYGEDYKEEDDEEAATDCDDKEPEEETSEDDTRTVTRRTGGAQKKKLFSNAKTEETSRRWLQEKFSEKHLKLVLTSASMNDKTNQLILGFLRVVCEKVRKKTITANFSPAAVFNFLMDCGFEIDPNNPFDRKTWRNKMGPSIQELRLRAQKT